MAFTFDAKTESSATSTGLTVSHTTAATAEILVCGLVVRGVQTITSVTYNGVSLSTAVDFTGPAGDLERAAILYLLAPASGANNLIVTLSGSVLHQVAISTWQADSGTITVDATGTNSNTGTSVSPSVTCGASTGLLGVDMCSSEENVAPPMGSAGGDQTILFNSGSGSYGAGSSYELAPSSGETFNWTVTAGPSVSTWTHAAAIFLEGGAAVAPVMPESFQAIPFIPPARS